MKVRDFSTNSGRVRNDAGELYGIELEVENGQVPNDVDGSGWGFLEDGSLRNSGLEFLSKPVTLEALQPMFTKFYEWFRRYSFHSNVRTSTHVHVNMLDYEMEQVGAALAAYAVVEPLLFKVCGTEREENIYCVPWYRAPEQARIAKLLLADDWNAVTMSCKYSSLYLEPLYRFGTLEFRQAPLFTTADDLQFWVELIRATTHGAISTFGSADLVLEYVHDRGVYEFVNALFGNDLAARLRLSCPEGVEQIIDDADSITIAESMSWSLCTYKVTNDAWVAPSLNIEGEGAAGYRNIAFRRATPAYELDVPDDYDDHEEYYEDDEEMY